MTRQDNHDRVLSTILKNFCAGLPLLLLALLFWSAASGHITFLNLDDAWFVNVLKVEALAVYSGFFLGGLVLYQPEKFFLRFLFPVLFILVILAYAGASYALAGGWQWAFSYLVLVLSTFAGQLIFYQKQNYYSNWGLGMRLSVCLTALFGIAGIINNLYGTPVMGVESTRDATLNYGLAYFLTLGLVEVSGIYQNKWFIDYLRKMVRELKVTSYKD